MFWGEKDTRAPEGAPVALRATDWAAPLVTAGEMALVVPEPAVTVAEVGAAEIENSGGTTGVDDDGTRGRGELRTAGMFWGEEDTRAPEGAPVALRATDWAAPLVTAVEMALVVPEPAVTVAALGAAEIAKSGGTTTVRTNDWVAAVPTPLPALRVIG